MRKFLLLTGVASLLFITSCGGDDEPAVNLLIGEWELDEIVISDPPAGYSFELINTEPSSTLLAESKYTIEFNDDFTYERVIEDASLFDTNGNEIISDLEDDGQWEQDGDRIDLDQENADFTDIPTRFEIVELDDRKLIVTASDAWFAWPPVIANDPQALDTVTTNAGFSALLIEYAEVIDATFTMEFDRD